MALKVKLLSLLPFLLSEKAEGKGFVEIQAEQFTYRNDSSIRATCEYDPDLSPYEVKNKALNTIDSASFKDSGQKVTYEFPVEQAGNYYRIGSILILSEIV